MQVFTFPIVPPGVVTRKANRDSGVTRTPWRESRGAAGTTSVSR